MFRVIALAVVVALSTFACATDSAAQTGAMMADPVKASVAALAAKVGISENYVTLAMTAATTLLGQGKDQAAAVKSGVEQAATKATADGKAMTTEQTGALSQGLLGLLGQK
jgi:Na+-transporting NADH:ubiquinone oxidoreductase subunit NqrD